MKAAGVTKYIGMGSGPMMMPGEKPGGFQRAVHPLPSVLTFFGVDMLEQNEWDKLAPHVSSGPQPKKK
jgi:hypothetical protein